MQGLDLFKQIAEKDTVKDVLPKAADGLKKLRDLEQQVSSGMSGGAQAMQGMMKQAGSAMGGLQQVMGMIGRALANSGSAQPTIPTGSYNATHEQGSEAARTALRFLQRELNILITFQSAMTTMNDLMGSISKYDDHEEFIRRMDLWSNIYSALGERDLGILAADEINTLLSTMNRALVFFDSLPEYFFVHYNISPIVQDHVPIIRSLDFMGMDKAVFNKSATDLIKTMLDVSVEKYGAHCQEQFALAAATLVKYLNKEWELDPVQACIKAAIDQYYPELHGMLIDENISYEKLTALLQKLIDSIDACSVTKAIGSPNGSSSSIPQIGSMIDKTLQDFLQKSINDKGKIQEALKKFTKQQTIVEKKRQIIKEMHKKDSYAQGGDPMAGTDAKEMPPVLDFGTDPPVVGEVPVDPMGNPTGQPR